MKVFDRLKGITRLLAVLAMAGGLAAAQQPAKPPAQPPAPRGQQQQKPEQKITPEQAKELFASVDEILKFASEDSQLPIRGPVKRELMSRSQLHQYLVKKIAEDRETQRMKRSEAVLKKFGLVPLDFQLEKFLLALLEEQVAAFYEPKTKTVYLLDWVDPDTQRPVLAHELTHALQDQNFDLDQWMKVKPDPPGKDDSADKPTDPYDMEPDEARAAREAVTEGQAMVVYMDYALAGSGRTVADSPALTELFKQQTAESTKDSPILESAPMYIRESLIFSYTFGLDFEQKLLAAGGKQLAFDAALRVPPADTRQIMEPQRYLDREKLPPLAFPRIKEGVEKSKYVNYDAGEIGQFDIYVMLKQFSKEKAAEEEASTWRGAVYWVVQKPGLERKQPVQPSDLALFYLSRWATPGDATRFAEQYRSWLPQRYKRVEQAAASATAGDFAQRVSRSSRWSTESGPVYIEAWGQLVIVLEGFDDRTAAGIRETVLEKPPADVPRTGPEVPKPEPQPTPLIVPPPKPAVGIH